MGGTTKRWRRQPASAQSCPESCVGVINAGVKVVQRLDDVFLLQPRRNLRHGDALRTFQVVIRQGSLYGLEPAIRVLKLASRLQSGRARGQIVSWTRALSAGRVAVASAHPKNGGVFRIENNSARAVFDFGAPKFLPGGAAIVGQPKSAFADSGNNCFRPGRGGSCLPPLPQIRTCPIKASGSSSHGFAALGDTGHGRTKTRSKARYFVHGSCPRRFRRDSHFRHRHTTA